ncbi:hypothetical protein G3578_18330 [Brevibacillus sp. SYP-B805]|uniref:hypothetical protein n=1 Tax=Brevibacillus sp. SYP-B805 TaxID=1578199 RepID=UPI0013E9FF4C|nr:hypothetical protein [Brevibacillus sp. SYP-B805]NGQ97100.1 hypothetical protein [Brevibacillus sp. SYP-B805]
MWTKWVTIHESYGLPRAAHECRKYLEHQGIRVKLSGRARRSVFLYTLQVPQEQKERAISLLSRCKKQLRDG